MVIIGRDMKALLPTAVAIATIFAAADPASASPPIEGRWVNGKMQIRIAPCGKSLCGTVIKASPKQQAKAEKGSGTELIGATLIRDIRPVGAGRYSARVFVADKNIHAKGTIHQLARDRLNVKGCAVFGMVCKSAQWDRIGR